MFWPVRPQSLPPQAPVYWNPKLTGLPSMPLPGERTAIDPADAVKAENASKRNVPAESHGLETLIFFMAFPSSTRDSDGRRRTRTHESGAIARRYRVRTWRPCDRETRCRASDRDVVPEPLPAPERAGSARGRRIERDVLRGAECGRAGRGDGSHDGWIDGDRDRRVVHRQTAIRTRNREHV